MQTVHRFTITIAALLSIFLYNATDLNAQSLNERVLVVYNDNIAESRDVAYHYKNKRGVPDANMLAIYPSNDFEISNTEFLNNVRTPIRNRLDRFDVGRNKILYIVFSYRTPYRVTGAPATTGVAVPAGDNGAGTSIDQYVAKIFDTSNSGTNPYYVASFSKANSYQPFISLEQHRTQTSALTYSVWRLDAPTVELSKGLVDKAIFAETNGLRGNVYADRGRVLSKLDSNEPDTYGSSTQPSIGVEWDMYRAAEFAREVGFPVHEDITGFFNGSSRDITFGTSPAPLRADNAAMYAGWYNLNGYNDAFTWNTGAIGFDYNSQAAVDFRIPRYWCGGALSRGITVTGGAINEPYATNVFYFDGIFRNLFEGANVGDAFLRNTPLLKWRLVYIGDPLYRPFAGRTFPAPSAPIPSPWITANVGAASTVADAFNENFRVQVSGSGEIHGTNDSHNYVHQTLNGDGRIIARVSRTEYTGIKAVAGVMFRESLDAGSRRTALTITGNGRLQSFTRFDPNQPTNERDHSSNGQRYYPQWLMIERRGNTFDFHQSFDGVTWTFVDTRTVNMATNAFVGLVTTNEDASANNKAFYDKARVIAPSIKGRVFANRPRGRTGTTGIAPATIQAEDFDNGGQSVVYRDDTTGNIGGAYRTTDVDIKSDGTASNSYAVFEARAGEWMEYTIDVETSGTYAVAAKVASAQGGGKFHVEIDGGDVTGSLIIPATGSSSSYRLVGKNGINLSAGVHILRIALEANDAEGKVGDFDTIEVSAGILNVAPQPVALNTNNFYRLTAKHSGKFMDVSEGSYNDGAAIVQNTDSTQKSQRFWFSLISDGYYTIAAKHSNKCIQIEGGSGADLARAVQASCNSSPSQQFSIVPVSDGYYAIRARHSGKALDVLYASQSDGATVIQYVPHNGDSQVWKFESLSTCEDKDGDGYCVGQDCNDADRNLYPHGDMFCEEGEDINCNGIDDFAECGYVSGYYLDPIIIDVDGDGFDLTDGTNGVHFDLNNDGVKEKLAWTTSGSDDAWLTLDRNNNGAIDDGSELFGNFSLQPDSPVRNGFLALAGYDKPDKGGNNDGLIDSKDVIFSSLRLWQDTNHNGISEATEMHTMPVLGISSIDLDYKESKRTDEHGNRFRYRAKVKDIHGQQVGRWAWDVFLVSAP